MRTRILLGLALVAALVLPRLRPLGLPGSDPQEARKVFDRIRGIPPTGRLLVALDFDPSSRAELEPQVRAVLAHAFRSRLRIVALTLEEGGRDLALSILRDCAREAHAREGEDWAFLGWRPSAPATILALGRDIPRTFPRDARGVGTKSLPVMQNVLFLRDFQALAVFAHRDSDLEAWLVYGQGGSGIPMVAGTTAPNAADMEPFLKSGQLAGLLNGLRGAAAYERLDSRPGAGAAGMDGLALGSAVILASVLLAQFRRRAR